MSEYTQWMTAQADKQNKWNAEQTEKSNQFNAQEAQKNRDWQEQMSNTALQRKMQDAEKAGLNPIFALNAQGASTTSGATASADSSKPATDIINAMRSYTNAQEQNRMQRELALQENRVKVQIAQMQMQPELQRARLAANAQMAAANAAAAASRYGADRSYNASRYSSDTSYKNVQSQNENKILTQGVNPTGVLYNNKEFQRRTNNLINKGFNLWDNIKAGAKKAWNKVRKYWGF